MAFDPNGTFYIRIDAKSDVKRREKIPLTNPNSDINMTGNSVMADKTQPPKHEYILDGIFMTAFYHDVGFVAD